MSELISLGISHKTAPVEVRERLDLGERDDVAAAHGDVGQRLGGGAVDGRQHGVGQRDEAGLVPVEEVGRPAAVAVGRELQDARDPQAIGVDGDADAADLHCARTL